MSDNVYVVVTNDCPSTELRDPELWWRADIVIAGVFGADRTVVATGWAKRNKAVETIAQTQGSAIAEAWHKLHQATPIRRP